jgi:hypothetical protein
MFRLSFWALRGILLGSQLLALLQGQVALIEQLDRVDHPDAEAGEQWQQGGERGRRDPLPVAARSELPDLLEPLCRARAA